MKALSKALVDQHLLPHVAGLTLIQPEARSLPKDSVDSHVFEFQLGKSEVSIPSTWLSQGYQATISWIADLIGQYYLDAGEVVPLDQMEGLVLIDELDLHLHPVWQVTLVTLLKKTFPKIQFVCTTHSPMVLPGLEAKEIRILKLNDEGNVVVEEPTASPKLMTGSEIFASFFNLTKLYPNDLANELRRYTYLATDPTRSDEEDAEMRTLEAKLTSAGINTGVPPLPRESL